MIKSACLWTRHISVGSPSPTCLGWTVAQCMLQAEHTGDHIYDVAQPLVESLGRYDGTNESDRAWLRDLGIQP